MPETRREVDTNEEWQQENAIQNAKYHRNISNIPFGLNEDNKNNIYNWVQMLIGMINNFKDLPVKIMNFAMSDVAVVRSSLLRKYSEQLSDMYIRLTNLLTNMANGITTYNANVQNRDRVMSESKVPLRNTVSSTDEIPEDETSDTDKAFATYTIDNEVAEAESNRIYSLDVEVLKTLNDYMQTLKIQHDQLQGAYVAVLASYSSVLNELTEKILDAIILMEKIMFTAVQVGEAITDKYAKINSPAFHELLVYVDSLPRDFEYIDDTMSPRDVLSLNSGAVRQR